ncbi:oligosaccharide flippase family protein [Oscillatoria sp. CS-180]|uniref:lipopolysaccharide biosynthesis protein n=1 Tax=Oscillatoria sp. CS-180 TaxID=3021720 RepID=UPI00232DD4F3|nr:oligosaccharide flippase family protein [Oscillatoria sp. CS-180]MDB9529346.1 oligosaccharide flippase family protein [Oscillatoria sp. CS-180]
MTSSTAKTNRQILDGTLWVFLAEGLILPTGLITAGFLTRRLGQEGYGLFTLASVLVAWIEWSITSIFSRTTIKFVGEAEDWRSIGTLVLRLHLALSVGITLLVWLLAPAIAASFHEPALGQYLRLLSLDIPVFSMASAQRNILIGRGKFRERALATAGRWTLRLLLIVLLVGLGFSVTGAILGTIGASVVELVIATCFAPTAWFKRVDFPMRSLFGYAIPLFCFAMAMRLYDKLDLIILKLLGGSAEESGLYGAAQNLAFIPTILSISFSPLLLSSLSRLLAAGELVQAKELARHALRLVIGLLPIGAITIATAPAIVKLIYGDAFLPTAPILSVLIFSSLGLMMISIGTTILTAADRPKTPFLIAAPLLPLAICCHWWAIPRLNTLGAAWVTALVAQVGAGAMVIAIYRLWHIWPPISTFLRSLLVCGAIYAVAMHWSASGFWLLPQLILLALLVPIGFLSLGEFSRREVALMGSLLLGFLPTTVKGKKL